MSQNFAQVLSRRHLEKYLISILDMEFLLCLEVLGHGRKKFGRNLQQQSPHFVSADCHSAELCCSYDMKDNGGACA